MAFDALHRAGAIEYVAFPQGLAEKYQSFTQADLGRLRSSGYAAPFLGVDEGVARCVRTLLAQSPVNA
jgi:ADP-L-glycero-D-manno-heptose 6-epimerase